MQKFLGMAMSFALLFSTGAAQAEILKNLETSGSVEVQARAADNVSDFNSGARDFEGQAGTRLGAGLKFDLTDDAGANVSLYKRNREWGQAATEDLNTIQTNVLVGEANVNLKDVFWMNHKVGRQYVGDQGDLFLYFGPSQSHVFGLPVTGLDAWRATWMNDHMNVSVLVGKAAETAATFGATGADTDTDLRGISASCNKVEALNWGVQVYQTKLGEGVAADKNDHKRTDINIRASGKFGDGFSYHAEVIKNMGKTAHSTTADKVSAATDPQKAKGTAFLANVKFKQDVGFGTLKLKGEFAMGTGDDTADDDDKAIRHIASDYVPGLVWGGIGSVVGFGGLTAPGNGLTGYTAGGVTTGLTTFNAGAYINPASAEKLWLGAHVYSFSANKVLTGDKKALGSELDLIAKWKASDNVSVKLGYGFFKPGEGLRQMANRSGGTAGIGDEGTVSVGTADLMVRF